MEASLSILGMTFSDISYVEHVETIVNKVGEKLVFQNRANKYFTTL